MIESLETRGYKNIYIIDNASTYPPLLEFYQTVPHKVFRLKKNIGFRSLWKTNLWYRFFFNYYVYTDSDVLLVDNCPKDFLKYLHFLLIKYPEVHKIGLSLKIDDLPNHYSKRSEVINWEKQFYEKEKEANVYIAPVDTTFALYRPFSTKGKCDGTVEMLRTGYPYQLEHLPWYIDSNNLDQEELFYIKSTTQSTHWTEMNK